MLKKNRIICKFNYYFRTCLAIGFVFLTVADSFAEIDLNQAKLFFQEAQQYCDRDNGQLWGRSLSVPMAFIDPVTRQLVTNQPDSAGLLKKQAEVYIGIWPEDFPIANFAWNYNGTRWTILIWPLPDEKTARASLMLHESFHNIQESLGFPANTPKNPHLGKSTGRIWLRIELAALKAALTTDQTDRVQSIKDALLFRAYRRELYEGSSNSEQQLEIYEGLAEYTGLRLCGLSLADVLQYLADSSFARRSNVPSFETSFAYLTGPAYGLLLDAFEIKWLENLQATDDLGRLMQSALNISLPKYLKESAEKRMLQYNGESIRSEEIHRELKHQKILADYRGKLVDGPVLFISLQQFNIQYDPNNIISLDNLGTVYPTVMISDIWGILTVTNSGALMSPNWNQITVPASSNIEANPLKGDGWTLELNEDWKIISADRDGDFTLISSK